MTSVRSTYGFTTGCTRCWSNSSRPAARGLSVRGVALRRIRPRDALGRTRRRLAVELVRVPRRLNWRIAQTTQALSDAVAASGTTLIGLLDVGNVVAANVLARTGPISQFPSAAAFRLVLWRGTDRGVLQ